MEPVEGVGLNAPGGKCFALGRLVQLLLELFWSLASKQPSEN